MPNYLEHMPLIEVLLRALVAGGLPFAVLALVGLALDPLRRDGKKSLDKRREPW